MRIFKKKEKGYRFYIEKYDLNGAYAGKKGVPLGVLLLYVLVKDCDVLFCKLSAEAEGELGSPHNIINTCDKSVFDSPFQLADLFLSQELVIWELTGEYKGVKVYITGRTYGSILGVRSPIDSTVNLVPLMINAEAATYNYHDYNQDIVEMIKSRFNINQRATILALVKMKEHRDVFNEFMKCFDNDQFVFPTENPVTVEGYSAKELYDNYPLSEIGAYNYLIYLRTNPKAAIIDLENGLPKK